MEHDPSKSESSSDAPSERTYSPGDTADGPNAVNADAVNPDTGSAEDKPQDADPQTRSEPEPVARDQVAATTDPPAEAADSSQPQASNSGESVTVTLNLDDPALRREIQSTLARHGYTPTDQIALDKPKKKRKAVRLAEVKSPLPRELVLAWCLWLLGGLLVTWVMNMPAAEMIRWMVMGSLLGMSILWPAFRLSQQGSPSKQKSKKTGTTSKNEQDHPITPSIILRDWFFLMLVFQAVIWPLRLTAQWTIVQTVWLDAAVSAWTLLAAALTAWGCRSTHGRDRTIAMLLCLLLVFGEPVAMWLANLGTDPPLAPRVAWAMRISPIETVWTLTHLSAVNVARPTQFGWLLWPLSSSIIVVAVAALLTWIAVGLISLRWRAASPIASSTAETT